MASLSAVLLAGGKSERMGQDKALLRLPGCGLLLWQRQLRVLEELDPQEILWSGPERPGLPGHIRVVTDMIRTAGPLAGVCACLRQAASDLVVVLAVDLPHMDAPYLKALTQRCTPVRGAVPQRSGELEPLAAVYPAMLSSLAADRLRQGRYAMHDFVREAVRRELMEIVPVGDEDAAKFTNLNSPEDLASLEGHSR
ncbi:MAG TPA: molybdenum cofactor guanylyltransferase [Candidatus Methylacidiphilales bacterium]|jgi:molybdopterin-guanine dinucleotide biosynthesis protein A|nr:molybdenum cofactor guanylyltransferase [Candidatus Methylacidiphilales bacterium]